MSRFFHECFTDPAVGATIGFALIVALFLAWLVVKDKLKRRRQRQGHRRHEERNKRERASNAATGPSA